MPVNKYFVLNINVLNYILFGRKITIVISEKHHVLVYLEDAVHQLLNHKDDNPKVNATKFLRE